MNVRKIDDITNCDFKYFKIVESGNIVEITKMEKKNNGSSIRKINNDLYEDLRTGEVKEYNKIKNRSELFNGVKRSMNLLKYYISCNVLNAESVRWLTFTYRENMTNTKQLYEDFRRFWERFKYHSKKNGFEIPNYINVCEPQGRGAWHIHSFFIYEGKAPFIHKNADTAKKWGYDGDFLLESIWGNGFVKINVCRVVDNPGAYFTAYLTDMPFDEFQQSISLSDIGQEFGEVVEKTFLDENGNSITKKFVKGARLRLYPPKFNLFRTSRNIKKPVLDWVTSSDAEKKASELTETFSQSYEVVFDTGITNTISKSYYKKIISHSYNNIK